MPNCMLFKKCCRQLEKLEDSLLYKKCPTKAVLETQVQVSRVYMVTRLILSFQIQLIHLPYLRFL